MLPWGLALVEGENLWVGNFGDGLINNYNPVTRRFHRDAQALRWNNAAPI